MEEAKFWRLMMTAVIIAVFGVFFAAFSKHCCHAVSMPATIEWDLKGIREQVEEQVHGQRPMAVQLANSLQWTLKDAEMNQEDTPRLKVVFLLGGPGVGKTKTMQIVANNVKCHYNSVFRILPCSVTARSITPLDGSSDQTFSDNSKTTKYHGTHYNTISMDLTNFTSGHALGFANLELGIGKQKQSRRIAIVSGRVMTMDQLEGLKTTKAYEKFINQRALEIGKLMKECAPRVAVEIVRFRSLKPSHAFLCLKDAKGVDFAYAATYQNLHKDDYYPQGCYDATFET